VEPPKRLGLMIEAVGFVLDVGVWEHAELARVGCDLPYGGVADALGGEQLLLGYGRGGGLDGEEGDWAVEKRNELRMAVVDGAEAKGHVEREFDAVTVLPGAVEVGPGTGGESGVDSVAVDCDLGLGARPRRDAQCNSEALRMREREVHAGVAIGGVLGVLGERGACASLLPGDARGDVEVDIDALGAAEVRADAVVGGELREGAGAAGPLLFVVDLFGVVVVVVGIVEADAVGADRPRAEDGVVEDGLHGVAVAAVAGDAHEVAGDLELAVGAAWRLEAAVGLGEAVGELVGLGLDEAFVGAPASGGVALSQNEGEAVAGGSEVLLTAVGEVCLHRGAEPVDVAVGVLAGKHVDVLGERAEVGVVLQEALGELAVTRAGSTLVGEVEVFRKRISLVPGPGDIFVRAGCHLRAIESLRRKERQDGVCGVVEDGEGLWIVGELMRVDEAAVGLVEGVGGDAVVFVKLFADGGGEAGDETMDLGLRRLVAGDGIGARETGDPLAEGVARNIAGHILRWIEEAGGGVPATQVFAGSGLAGELTEGLEDAVLVEVEKESMVLLELHEHGAVEELHVFIVELGEGRGSHCGGSRRGKRACIAENGGAGSECCTALEEGSTR
jgi:hypothetical protein